MLRAMTYATHRYLGELLYPELCAGWNVRLNEEAFLYGCVKPDVSSLFIRHPHFWKLSKGYAFRLIEDLTSRRLKPGKAHRRFSEDLGILLHYVADFFTAVHNLSPNPIRDHLEFERQLHGLFLAEAGPETIGGFFTFRGEVPSAAAAIRGEIAERHRRYAPDRTRPDRDLREIQGACVFAAAAVMDAAELNICEASRRLGPQPGILPVPVPQGSAPDTADFR